jgi:hypothetical protein
VLSIEGNNISRDFTKASKLAKETIEFYESQDSMTALPMQTKHTAIAGMYNRQVFINDNATDSTIPAGLAKIDVIITWTDKMGEARSSSYSTFMKKD